jgi:hypothetical protein
MDGAQLRCGDSGDGVDVALQPGGIGVKLAAARGSC